MNLEGFIIDTPVCIVELKSEIPVAFYERLDPCVFNTMMGNVELVFVDRLERTMNKSEWQFVECLFWQCVEKPVINFFSMLEQWLYWVGLDANKLWEYVELLETEGENDES